MKSTVVIALVLSTFASVARAQPVATPKPGRIAGIYYVPSGSMEPTLPLNARIWASTLAYQKAEPKRNDIVLLQLPLSLVSPGENDESGTTIFVKRIVGVPGDRIEMRNGVLWVNGKSQKEPFVLWRDESPSGPPADYRYDMKVARGVVYSREHNANGSVGEWLHNSVVVPNQSAISNAKTEALPAHKYLALGDHRSNSNDSHVFGLIDRAQVKAKVTLRIYPSPHTF